MKHAPLFESLGIRQRGVLPSERLAGQIVVGLELRHLKKTLGYTGGGEWNAYRGIIRPTWEELCKAQAGFTEATERGLHLCAEAVKVRLAAGSLRNAEADRAWELMETPPSELTETERQELVQGILKHALKEGDTRQSLIDEFKPAVLMLKMPAVPDKEAAQRGAEPPQPGGDPANRFRDMVAFAMARGCGLKRACEITLIMMPDEMLTPAELAWKRMRRQLAENFCETVAKKSPES
jgi:hypothetical protein